MGMKLHFWKNCTVLKVTSGLLSTSGTVCSATPLLSLCETKNIYILQSWERLWWCGTRSRAWMSAKNWTKAKLTLAKMATILLAAEGAMEDSQRSNGTSNCGSNAIGSSSVDCIGIASGVPTGFLLPSHNLSHAHTITIFILF